CETLDGCRRGGGVVFEETIVSVRLLGRITLEACVPLRPAVGLVTRWAHDRIHLLDGRCLEDGRVHGVSRVDHLPGVWTLDDNPVHAVLVAPERRACLARKVPKSQRLAVRLRSRRAPFR